jgi:hypothetical protein
VIHLVFTYSFVKIVMSCDVHWWTQEGFFINRMQEGYFISMALKKLLRVSWHLLSSTPSGSMSFRTSLEATCNLIEKFYIWTLNSFIISIMFAAILFRVWQYDYAEMFRLQTKVNTDYLQNSFFHNQCITNSAEQSLFRSSSLRGISPFRKLEVSLWNSSNPYPQNPNPHKSTHSQI